MPARRHPLRRVNIKPEPVVNQEYAPPLPQPFGTAPPSFTVQVLDAAFQRVIEPEHLLPPSQKTYIEEQEAAFDDEKHILHHIVKDARDLMNSIHHFELRHQPDQNIPLFFDKEYQNFKLRIESYELLKLIIEKAPLFAHHFNEAQDDPATDDEISFEDMYVHPI